MSRKLDAAVAEAMELNLVQGQAPRYSEGIAAARAMEDWIEGHGNPIQYAVALQVIVETHWGVHCNVDISWTDFMRGITWRIAHATPEQRCLAFLKARGVEWREEE